MGHVQLKAYKNKLMKKKKRKKERKKTCSW